MELPRLEKITPAKAAQYLNANRSNRPLNEGRAEMIAEDMRNGTYECPSSIVFYEDGDLADGQHRLWVWCFQA